ncbi:phosphatase PAP2 family protein [Streptomyces sp. AM 3-1-1]|nr:phosphatase PAP2 family protein [Streptomyces sp. AM 3-1-1]WEH30065.1 phosphatase PAP2 family protein [Streptomyces sp. AM 3-1-1]
MNETPRPRETASGAVAWPPQSRTGRAFAHIPGASGPGLPHRSDGRSPHTPRGARFPGPPGRPGTSPPVPGRPAVVLSLCAVLFAFLTWQLVARGPLRRLDERLGVRPHDGAGLPHPLAEFFSDLGNTSVAVPVLAVSAAVTWWVRRGTGRVAWWPALTALFAILVVPALVLPLKEIFDRPGQPSAEGLGYYPSGHTATATVAYGVALLLLLAGPVPPHRRDVRRALTATWLLLVVCVSYGLVRQGYHWPLDVAASWCLGGAVLQVVAVVLVRTRVRVRERPRTQAPDDATRRQERRADEPEPGDVA